VPGHRVDVRLARYTGEMLTADQRKPLQKPGLFNLRNAKSKSAWLVQVQKHRAGRGHCWFWPVRQRP